MRVERASVRLEATLGQGCAAVVDITKNSALSKGPFMGPGNLASHWDQSQSKDDAQTRCRFVPCDLARLFGLAETFEAAGPTH